MRHGASRCSLSRLRLCGGVGGLPGSGRQEGVEVEIVERKGCPDMRPWAVQGHDGVSLPAGVLERKTRRAEGDLVILPSEVAGQLAVADGRCRWRLLPHPGKQRGNAMGFGRKLALAGKLRPGRGGAI